MSKVCLRPAKLRFFRSGLVVLMAVWTAIMLWKPAVRPLDFILPGIFVWAFHGLGDRIDDHGVRLIRADTLRYRTLTWGEIAQLVVGTPPDGSFVVARDGTVVKIHAHLLTKPEHRRDLVNLARAHGVLVETDATGRAAPGGPS